MRKAMALLEKEQLAAKYPNSVMPSISAAARTQSKDDIISEANLDTKGSSHHYKRNPSGSKVGALSSVTLNTDLNAAIKIG